MNKLLLLGSHVFALTAGFGLGVYVLPILTAPDPPSTADVTNLVAAAAFTGNFRRDLKDSDALHWGEGTVSVAPRTVSLLGRIAPGPDYKLYLSPEFVETETEFARLKSKMIRLGDVKTFENFIVEVPNGVDPAKYNTVIVWCESFSQFITSAKYR